MSEEEVARNSARLKGWEAAHPRRGEKHRRGPRPTGLAATLETARRLEGAVRRFLALEAEEPLPQNWRTERGYSALVAYARRYLGLEEEGLDHALGLLRVIETLRSVEPAKPTGVRVELDTHEL